MINNILIMPDSFKGSLSATDFCKIAKQTINALDNSIKIYCIPVSDGGEGLIDCVESFLIGKRKYGIYSSPIFEKINSCYYISENNTCVIESAETSSLVLAKDKKSACDTTSLGLGEQIFDAINNGCTNIYIGIGGVASCDCGCGMAYALGAKFYNEDNKEFMPTGRTLLDVKRIDLSPAIDLLKNKNITILSDVTNPLFGKSGAAFVYAKQKGATDNEIVFLDDGLKHINDLLYKKTNIDNSEKPGAGAAGGLGFMFYSLDINNIKSGINTIIELSNMKEIVKNCELVITGEGKLDKQTFNGKVINGICNNKGNAISLCYVGQNNLSLSDLKELNIDYAYSINPDNTPLDVAIKNAKTFLKNKIIETLPQILKNN